MENLIKFLEDKITDKMSVEEIVDVFEQMCSTPLEEDMVLFETGTFTAFSKEPFFQISLVRQFSNDDEEFYQIHVVILYKPTAENKIFLCKGFSKFPFIGEIANPAEPVNGQDERRNLCAAVDSPACLC